MLNSARPFFCVLRWWLCALWLLAGQAFAQSPLPVPELKARVMDSTSTLTTPQQTALTAKLAEFEKAKGTQIVVLLVPTTQPETIEAYANRVANTWKVGRKEVGDGIVIVVAKNDRRLRIEVARALEGAVTDLQAKRIIDEAITPQFKQGDFAAGLSQGVDRLINLINGEPLPEPAAQGKFSMPTSFWVCCGILLLFGLFSLGLVFVFLALIWGAGIGAGALVLWLSGSWLWAVLAGMAYYVLLFYWASRLPDSTVSSSDSSVVSNTPSVRIWTESVSSSGSGWFGSGGGGSFGGGGASGSW